ncbi:MAG TPA: acyl carrier protein [Thermodesulfovibrionales bacterium]|nr:acyl carrier protein [Thermodesulfovibrionales bacterium]
MRDKIRQFIFENYLFVEQDDSLRDDDSFLEKGIIDSTGILELVAFLEESCGIKIADEELIPEHLDSVNNLIAFINSKEATV